MPASPQTLCAFIDASPSPFHVCATVAERLRQEGFTELSESDAWPSTRGAYFTVRAGSLVAWRTAAPDAPFRIVGGHTDSPNLRVKQHPDRVVGEVDRQLRHPQDRVVELHQHVLHAGA